MRESSRARELRAQPSVPEKLLWKRLRDRKLAGLKFRRQHPIGPYVADFYCHEARLVVEVDGSSHCLTLDRDRRRDQYMTALGLRVMRIPVGELRTRLDKVVEHIAAAARSPSPQPSPASAGEGV